VSGLVTEVKVTSIVKNLFWAVFVFESTFSCIFFSIVSMADLDEMRGQYATMALGVLVLPFHGLYHDRGTNGFPFIIG
jgi:hypothetical protein